MLHTLLTHTPIFYLVQSLWRDEAFSILAAERPLGFIVSRLGFEPPVYYAMLHFWIRIFGESEIATRSLSLLGLVLATIIIIRWSEHMFKKHWLAWFTPLFFILNPMLLYYAFEVRTYGWYMFFATASLYAYSHKKWFWFTTSAILGFYTHTYFMFHLTAIGIHWLVFDVWKRSHTWKSITRDTAFKSFLTIGFAMAPWLIKIIQEASRLKNSWYYPVDLHLVYSLLGNMFTGYEGTPWYGWTYTKYLSILLLLFGVLAYRDSKEKRRNLLFLFCVGIPLGLCVGISFIKPLFVNRYLVSSTIALVLVVIAAIQSIRNATVQKICAASLLALVIGINWWFPQQHAKLPIRETMNSINSIRKTTDVYFAATPIIYLEVKYYASDRSRVYLYNPTDGVFPWYIGDAIISANDMAKDLPMYPTRAFLIRDDGSYEIVYRMPITNTTIVPRKK
jgi:uncharacterized membrane protein